MFCSRCGSQIAPGAGYCSNCGAQVPVMQFSQLPAGMTMGPDGRIWWSFMEKREEVMCYLGAEELAVMHEAKEKKSSALGSVLKEAINFAATFDDNYQYMEEPFPTGEGEPPKLAVNGKMYYHYPYPYRSISTMKEDRKHCTIKLFCYTWWTLRLTPEQYDFVLKFLLTHCPNIRRK